MRKQNKLASDLVRGDRLIAASDGLTHVVERIFFDEHGGTVVLFKEPTRHWAAYANRMCVQVVEHWANFDAEFPRELTREFGQGWEFETEFLVPLWADACRCLEDELAQLDEPDPNDEILHDLVKRRISAGLQLMMFGKTGVDQVKLDSLDL